MARIASEPAKAKVGVKAPSSQKPQKPQRPRLRAAVLATWTFAVLCVALCSLFTSPQRTALRSSPRVAFFAAGDASQGHGVKAAAKPKAEAKAEPTPTSAARRRRGKKKSQTQTQAQAQVVAKAPQPKPTPATSTTGTRRRRSGGKKKKKSEAQLQAQQAQEDAKAGAAAAAAVASATAAAAAAASSASTASSASSATAVSASASGRRVALLIDGESQGPDRWATVVDAARACGNVEHALLFAEPGTDTDPETGPVMEELGLSLVPVPRKTSGKANPNDMAIAIAAARLISSKDVNHIAMVVKDTDYLYMAEQLKTWGASVSVLLPGGGFSALAEAFEAAKAEVIWYADDGEDAVAAPAKFKGLLDERGGGSVVAMTPEEMEKASAYTDVQEADLAPLMETLQRLRYINDPNDPLVPAFAKFVQVNRLGPVPVWPSGLAQSVAVELYSNTDCQSCKPNPGHLALILPQDGQYVPTKEDLKKYGSDICVCYARGGVPFMEKDGNDLVIRVLRQLGYEGAGDSPEEAVEVFYERNQGPLEELQVPHDMIPAGPARESILRGAFLSSRCSGNWNCAPDNTRVQEVLVKKGYLEAMTTSHVEVSKAMQAFAKDSGLQPRESYIGTLHLLLRHLGEEQP